MTRNRYGREFKPGTHCVDRRGWSFTYVRLDKPSDYSRAYGRQALVAYDHHNLKDARKLVADGDGTEIGIDDLRPILMR